MEGAVNSRQCHRARCRLLEQCGRQGIVLFFFFYGNDEGAPFPHALKVGPEPRLEFARADRVSSHVVIVTTSRACVEWSPSNGLWSATIHRWRGGIAHAPLIGFWVHRIRANQQPKGDVMAALSRARVKFCDN